MPSLPPREESHGESSSGSSSPGLPSSSGAGPTRLDLLASQPIETQERAGFVHTLREVRQQPDTWDATAETLAGRVDALTAAVRRARIERGRGRILLTGSGSSLFVGECLAPTLQAAFGVPVHAVAGGDILTHPRHWILPDVPTLVVSFARSGDSPESPAVLDLLAREAPEYAHLVITCNRTGRLALAARGRANVRVEVLDDRTCDRSLVMTSSFTNMVVAGRALAYLDAPASYLAEVRTLARVGREVLARDSDTLAALAVHPFSRALTLASGGRLGAAREGALKLLEMSEGQVFAAAETFLGLRHGPMNAAHDDTIVIAFLSSDPLVRTYELDVLDELRRKRLGLRRVIVGDALPDLREPSEMGLAYPGLGTLTGDAAAVIDALTLQVLAFFRCLALGLRPDDPSRGGVIARVVETFAIHT